MQVTELRDDTGDGEPVALHRHVTIVQSADEQRRSWVLRAVGLIAEEHDVPAAAVVVRSEDLPGHDPSVAEALAARDVALANHGRATTELKAARAEVTRAIDERIRVAAELEAMVHGAGPARDAVADHQAERARLEAELGSVRRQFAVSEEALAAAVGRHGELQGQQSAAGEALDLAKARRRATVDAAVAAAAALESARSLDAPGADPVAELAAARQHLADAEGEADVADPDGEVSPINQRLADLERQRVSLTRRMLATGDSAAAAVQAATVAVVEAAGDAPANVAALALADTWRDLHQQIEALDSGVSEAEREADADLAQAHRRVAEAQIIANQPLLTPEQVAKVEAAHNEVLEAQERSEGRFGGSRARKKLDELRSDERRVLERLGLSTYADYMMSSSSRDLSAGRESVESARSEVRAAQDRLDAIPGSSDRARRRIELLERRDTIAPKITALLGYEPAGPEAEHALRTVREPAHDEPELLTALADALGSAGIDVGPAPHDSGDLLLLGRAYLAEDEQAEGERHDLKEAIAAVDAAVAHLRAARDRGEVEIPDDLDLPPVGERSDADDDAGRTLREARWAEVESARASVVEAEARAARHSGLTEELVALQAAMDDASRREQAAADEVTLAEATVDEVADPVSLEQAAAAVADAQTAFARHRSAEAEAEAAVAAMDGTGSEQLVADGEIALSAAESLVTQAGAVEQLAIEAMEAAEAGLQAATDAADAASTAASVQDRETLVGDIDWALLNRLAGVRPTGGSDPLLLLLDDPFAALRDDEVHGVLDRLSRFAPMAQVIVLSDRAVAADWAASVSPDRAAIVMV